MKSKEGVVEAKCKFCNKYTFENSKHTTTTNDEFHHVEYCDYCCDAYDEYKLTGVNIFKKAA